MKKLFCLLCVFAMLISLCACKNTSTKNNTTPTDTGTPTESSAPTETTPTANTLPTDNSSPTESTTPTQPKPTDSTVIKYEGPFNKNVPEFIALLSAQYPELLTGINPVQEKNFCNVTPPEVAAETNMQIFYHSFGKTFILLDSQTNGGNSSPEILETGGSFTGAIPWDYDGDGIKDLLMSYTFGSGLCYNSISVFNPATKEFTHLYSTSKLAFSKRLLFAQSAANIHFPGMTEADAQLSYPVLEVDFDFKYKTEDSTSILISKEYTVTDIHGHIAVKDGKPEFVPYEK